MKGLEQGFNVRKGLSLDFNLDVSHLKKTPLFSLHHRMNGTGPPQEDQVSIIDPGVAKAGVNPSPWAPESLSLSPGTSGYQLRRPQPPGDSEAKPSCSQLGF